MKGLESQDDTLHVKLAFAQTCSTVPQCFYSGCNVSSVRIPQVLFLPSIELVTDPVHAPHVFSIQTKTFFQN